MKNFDTRVYNIADFVEWSSAGLLNMSPEFQRRSVWSEAAKSYLIDTIIRGKPIPKLLITQQLEGTRNTRVVVDGQQRLRSILSFFDGDFKISKAHNAEFAGMQYNDLPEDVRKHYLKYEIGVDVLFDVSYEDVLDIFARLNTYSVSLNLQERWNAKYLGYFKQVAYRLGYRYVQYWIDANVITKKQVTRMAEAALASDLLVSLVGGVQSNKNIPQYYKSYEEEERDLAIAESRFDSVMSFIGEIYPAEDLRHTNYSRIQLFYSLFVAVAHALFSISNLEDAPRFEMTRSNIGKVRNKLDDISVHYDAEDPLPLYVEFIDASRRATTDTGRRKYRSTFLCQQLDGALQE